MGSISKLEAIFVMYALLGRNDRRTNISFIYSGHPMGLFPSHKDDVITNGMMILITQNKMIGKI